MKSLGGMDFSDEAYVRSTLIKMVVFFACYFAFYKILRRTTTVSAEYCCRLITFVHGLIACYCALYYVVLPSLGQYDMSGESSTSRHDSPKCDFHGLISD